VLVGAQAVYLHTGAAQFAVAEFTTDGDVAVDPRALAASPEVASAMRAAGFELDVRGGEQLVGVWAAQREIGGVPAKVTVDLLVPDALGGPGRRAARVPPHERRAMLKVHGLEATLVDHTVMNIGSLEATDTRRYSMKVAGPTSLLVSKTIKLSERAIGSASDRAKPKDALDVLRLMQAIPAARFAEGCVRLTGDRVAGPVVREALGQLPHMFGTADAPGSVLAAQAAAPEPPDVVAASCAALCGGLLDAFRGRGIGI
jgi:hypothetical protein